MASTFKRGNMLLLEMFPIDEMSWFWHVAILAFRQFA